MTEAMWLTTCNEWAVWRFLRDRPSPRRTRLFACGAMRMTWGRLPLDWWETALGVAERLADGEDTGTQRGELAARLQRLEIVAPPYRDADYQAALMQGVNALRPVLRHLVRDLRLLLSDQPLNLWQFPSTELYRALQPIGARRLALVRDVFGNPFQPVPFDPSWRTEHSVGIAFKMYDDRAFGAMPILADALEEAGCDNTGILAHCRDSGIHVRGCWVVDAVLGK